MVFLVGHVLTDIEDYGDLKKIILHKSFYNWILTQLKLILILEDYNLFNIYLLCNIFCWLRQEAQEVPLCIRPSVCLSVCDIMHSSLYLHSVEAGIMHFVLLSCKEVAREQTIYTEIIREDR